VTATTGKCLPLRQRVVNILKPWIKVEAAEKDLLDHLKTYPVQSEGHCHDQYLAWLSGRAQAVAVLPWLEEG
jgi:hypothetical protein